jgi:hypothetical protein
MNDTSSIQVLCDLINSHVLARSVQVAAELGIADALDEESASAVALAPGLGVNADALDRVLRLLAAHGVFAHDGQGYRHTSASRLLRTDHPQSLRPFARMIGMPAIWGGFTDLEQAVRTGKPSMDWSELVRYFATHPGEARLFNEAMASKSAGVIPAVMNAYDFAELGVIADIGGGRGHLLRAVLQRAPASSGVLFELPHVIEDARDASSPRLRLVAGDFFSDPLPAADAYILMEVIHDWADEQALKILEAVRRAAPTHARLLIIETLVSEEPGPHFGKMLDIIMLAVTAGRERKPSEYRTLLRTAGFEVTRIIPTASHSIVEAVIR